MSTDFSIRPVGAPAPSPVVQPVSQAANSAVATELPASQSITAVDAATVTRNDAEAAVTFDISHQAVDQKTAEVVNQYPDEAVLRRRAYFNALEMSKDNTRRAIPTDRVA